MRQNLPRSEPFLDRQSELVNASCSPKSWPINPIPADTGGREIRRLATKRQIHSIDFDILQTFPEILLYSPSD